MMVTIAVISQPRYLPACNYLHRMILADVFVYLDTVRYTPRDWENRNRVKTAGGPVWLSVPVIRRKRDQRIFETLIDNEQNWDQKHLRTLRHAYGKAPFYDAHADALEDIYSARWERLIDLNCQIVEYACKVMDIDCTFVRASELGVVGEGESLLIDICKNIEASVYLSGNLGRKYINKNSWENEGIDVVYHDYVHPEYPQINGEFLPWMCFLDLLFNCGPKSRAVLLRGNLSRCDLLGHS